MTTDERYIRNIPSITDEECRTLLQKRVLIIGCGGLGGHLADLIARIGVKFIRVVDGDVFDTSNLNRQLLSEVDLIGTSKAKAAEARIRHINPDIAVEAAECFMTADNVQALVADCDIVLDGLDGIEPRKLLKSACDEAGIPYIYGAVAGWVAQAAVSIPGDHLIDKLYPAGVAIKDKSVLSFTPSMCASMQVALAVKVLLNRPVEYSTLYYFDLLNQEFELIPLG